MPFLHLLRGVVAASLPFVIALVEDDLALRTFLTTLLKREGMAVIEASNLAEAEPLLDEYPWDLAILDRHLPDGDALELCSRVRKKSGVAHRYILMLSGDPAGDAKVLGLDAGADDYMGKPIRIDELIARIRAARRIVEYQKDLLGRLSILEQMSVIDALTQVYNRRFFEAEAARAFDRSVRYERPLAMAMIDVDHFKDTNDTLGHAAGDHVLIELTTLLIQNIRSSDVLARYGGEEFALILPETSLRDAFTLVERVRSVVEATPLKTAAGMVHVTISAGVAGVPGAAIGSAAELTEAADEALYVSKRNGRNRVAIADPRRPSQSTVSA